MSEKMIEFTRFGNSPPDLVQRLHDVNVVTTDIIELYVAICDDIVEVYLNGVQTADTFSGESKPIGSVNLNRLLKLGENEIWIDNTDFGYDGENYMTVRADLLINREPPINPIDWHYRRVGQNGVWMTKRYIYKIIVHAIRETGERIVHEPRHSAYL